MFENLQETERTLREAAEAGCAVLKKHFRALESVQTKGQSNNLLTQADLECEATVLGLIRKRFPGHAIIAEETASEFGAHKDAEWAWILDPLDGTTNFAHGLPWFALSLGVWHEGAMLMGLVANPAQDEIYFARRGAGATRNGRPIRVSPASNLAETLNAIGLPYDRDKRMDEIVAQIRAVLPRSRCLRRIGSAALDMCLVASGVFGAYWEAALNPWDWAPGALIVQEAGGRVTDLRGQDFDLWQKDCLATNGLVHEQMLELLRV
ncbi:MAG: inositol monophosphatase family protein [Candidatus Sumerlaeota bacterium]|nr:inositol monophosphatase family protein [Candidatus Sumerlaeota bacterium]